MNDDYLVHFEGICQGGKISYAYSVTDTEGGEEVHKYAMSEPVVEGNNSYRAEYKAILAALLWLHSKGYHKDKFIRFLGHSEYVIRQMNGLEVLREHPYKEVAVRCLSAKEEHFWALEFEGIPEEFNGYVIKMAEDKILQTV